MIGIPLSIPEEEEGEEEPPPSIGATVGPFVIMVDHHGCELTAIFPVSHFK